MQVQLQIRFCQCSAPTLTVSVPSKVFASVEMPKLEILSNFAQAISLLKTSFALTFYLK